MLSHAQFPQLVFSRGGTPSSSYFPMSSHDRLLVGWSVRRKGRFEFNDPFAEHVFFNFVNYNKTHIPSYMN